CSEAKPERLESTTTLPRAASTMWAPGLWAEICSGQCVVPGLMRAGEDGGVRTRFTIRKFSCSLIILVRHWSWREARPFISLLTVFASHLNEHAMPPTERMSESEEER